MPYEITATRKRPQAFKELAGQEFVSATLEASLETGRIAHAYLFSGPRGCGKTSTARILAKALNCESGPTAKPCGTCSNCRSIAIGSAIDVIEIDGASNTSVDNVRQIKDEVLFPPNSGRYKVYIIDEVHMLSMSAFNALLKTIEEPPPYVVFIFATTELHKVPATIKSRCQQFAFRLIAIDTIKALLRSAASDLSVVAEDEALLWIAKEAGGSLRDAYTLFDQVVAFSDGRISAALIREKLGLVGIDAMNGLFEILVRTEESARPALEAVDELISRGISVEQCALDVIDYLRSLLLLANGIDREGLLGAPASGYSRVVLERLGSERIERGLALFLELQRNLRMSPNQRFELELAVTRLARLRSWVAPSELADAVATLRGALEGETTPRSAPADTASLGQGKFPQVVGSGEGSEKKKLELAGKLSSPLGSAIESLAGVLQSDEPKSSRSEPPFGAGMVRDLGESAQRPAVREAIEVRANADEREADLFAPEAEILESGPVATTSAYDDIALLRSELIARVARQNPLLGSGLAASADWRIEDSRLLISFRNGIEENIVRAELGVLAGAASAIAGRNLKVELRVGDSVANPGRDRVPKAGSSDPVSIVERVFRGQRVERKKRGGTDELR